GVYNLAEHSLRLFQGDSKTTVEDSIVIEGVDDPRIKGFVGEDLAATLRSDVHLIEGVYDRLDVSRYLAGEISPVFFGSAVNNFGVSELLNCFVEVAPSPGPRETDKGTVKPDDAAFSGFVFKIHANLDPRHRDR